MLYYLSHESYSFPLLNDFWLQKILVTRENNNIRIPSCAETDMVFCLEAPGSPVSFCKGPATRCDALHPRWDVSKFLRYFKIACDVLRYIFQHVGICAPDFRISQPFIIRFSNGLQHCDGNSTSYHVMSDSKLAVTYF